MRNDCSRCKNHLDRHVKDRSFALVPAVVPGAEALGLPFLRTLNLVEAPAITDEKVLDRLLAALKRGLRSIYFVIPCDVKLRDFQRTYVLGSLAIESKALEAVQPPR